jgi:hypothetical protein
MFIQAGVENAFPIQVWRRKNRNLYVVKGGKAEGQNGGKERVKNVKKAQEA